MESTGLKTIPSPIPQPPQYFLFNIRHLTKIQNISELEGHLQTFEIEHKLELLYQGDIVKIYDKIEAMEAEYRKPSQNVFTLFSNPAHIDNLNKLKNSMLEEKWGMIEKTYLYKIPWNKEKDKPRIISDALLLVVMVYGNTIDGRWISAYSSPLEKYKAEDFLKSFHDRILDIKGKIDNEPQAQLQKSKTVTYKLQIPVGEEIYIPDTNTLYKDHNFKTLNLSQKKHSFVITGVVLQELDKLKLSKGGRDKSIAILNSLNSIGDKISDLSVGCTIHKGFIKVFFCVFEPDANYYLPGLTRESADDRIIMTAKAIAEANPQNPVTLISTDSNVTLKSKALGINSKRI